MSTSLRALGVAFLLGVGVALVAGAVADRTPAEHAASGSTTVTAVPPDPLPSAIVGQAEATADVADWGTFYTYYAGETYGTQGLLAGVAVIDGGWEIHPPHRHPEEEYLMVTTGEGTWHLNGESSPAGVGDMLYAAPWDVHGITNTGTEPLTFVVWKASAKGVPVPDDPEAER